MRKLVLNVALGIILMEQQYALQQKKGTMLEVLVNPVKPPVKLGNTKMKQEGVLVQIVKKGIIKMRQDKVRAKRVQKIRIKIQKDKRSALHVVLGSIQGKVRAAAAIVPRTALNVNQELNVKCALRRTTYQTKHAQLALLGTAAMGKQEKYAKQVLLQQVVQGSARRVLLGRIQQMERRVVQRVQLGKHQLLERLGAVLVQVYGPTAQRVLRVGVQYVLQTT